MCLAISFQTEMARHPCLLIWGAWPFRHTGPKGAETFGYINHKELSETADMGEGSFGLINLPPTEIYSDMMCRFWQSHANKLPAAVPDGPNGCNNGTTNLSLFTCALFFLFGCSEESDFLQLNTEPDEPVVGNDVRIPDLVSRDADALDIVVLARVPGQLRISPNLRKYRIIPKISF